MRKSIPEMITNNTRSFYGFLRSAKNPSDDPTRGVKLREPERMEAFWLTELKKGSVEPLDAFLATTGHHRMQLSELPPEEELKPCKPLDLRTGSSLRREEKKRKRNANKREKQASLREAGTHKIAETEQDQGLTRGALTENGCSETGGQRSRRKEGGQEKGLSQLDDALVARLLQFGEDQFVWHSSFATLEEALRSGPGCWICLQEAEEFPEPLLRQPSLGP